MSSLYPLQPGHQNTDTSQQAAASMDSKAAVLRVECLRLVRAAAQHDPGVLLRGVKPVVKTTPARNQAGVPVGITVREAADLLGQDNDNVNPRFSELRAAGLIRDSGVRRRNIHSGRSAIAWTPGDDPDKAVATDNAPPARPAARAAYVRGLAASYYTLEAAANKEEGLQSLRRRLAELDKQGGWD